MSALAIQNGRTGVALTEQDIVVEERLHRFFEGKANLLASGSATIPRHLQGNVADCYAVVAQAYNWNMDPFAVAQKTHLVNGVLGYEAQLVNAVISSSTAIQGAFHYEWFGDWSKVIGNFATRKNQQGKEYQVPAWTAADEKGLGVRVSATLKGEEEPRVLDLLLAQAQVRNSTLWASDPKQQLAYLGVKRWARLYCPQVILGVYTPDELDTTPRERVINPAPASQVETKSAALAAVLNVENDELSSAAVDFLALLDDADDLETLQRLSGEISEAVGSGKLSDFDRQQLFETYKVRKKALAAHAAAGEPVTS